MSKIICDVCGTSYPETAAQCPICGCSRPADTQGTIQDDGQAGSAGGYTYVKGGRFSKANVRKRNLARQSAESENPSDSDKKPVNMNNWLIIIALVLTAAIIAVVLYVVLHYFNPFGGQNQPATTEPSTSETAPVESTDDTTEPTAEDVYCSALNLSVSEIVLDSEGASYQLDVTASPADTTDKIYFDSANEDIATVTDEGLVTAISEGETEIFITCGSIQEVCKVVCIFETEPTEESTESTEPTEFVELKLNREDFSLFFAGETWKVYDGELDVENITWTSDNERIAKIENGVVTAVDSGTTTVHAEYGEQKVSCIVRCEFPSTGGSGGVTSDGDGNGEYTISAEDVTIRVGESFTLNLKDSSGNVINVNWSVSNSGICSVSGNTVTGLADGTTVVEVTYEGGYYSCIVRVY